VRTACIGAYAGVCRVPVPGTLEAWSIVPRSYASIVLKSVVLLGLIGGLTAFVQADKTVTLSVDGKERQVRTFAGSVAGLLKQQGVSVGAHDQVTPSLDHGLSEGQQIGFRHGRLVKLTIDGETRDIWTTAFTVDEAVSVLGPRAQGAYLSASRSSRIPLSGMQFEMRIPKDVTVVVDGQRLRVISTAPTIGDVIAEAGVSVGAQDEVSADRTARPTDGLTVTIVRVAGRQDQVQISVPFGTQQRNDPNLLVGTTQVVQDGQPGLIVETYTVTTKDGVDVARVLASRVQIVAPVDKVIAIGTKPKPKPKPVVVAVSGIPSSGGLNWAALAQCESGGNPRAYNPSGPYYGLYQFTLGTWRAYGGGSGLPTDASAAEQTRVAQNLYAVRGTSPWPFCGRLL